MGELDDAIREHLELKRRRGADPAEVAREEQEALAPVTRGHPVVIPEDLEEAEAHSPAPARNGGAGPHDELAGGPAPNEHAARAEDAGDETQEFRVVFGSGDDWLEDEDES
jgi:hypothetical protein